MANQKNNHEILDVSKLNLTGSFDTQVGIILHWVRLTQEEVIGLRQIHNDLERELQKDWPGCKVYPFGSVITGLGIKTSDADYYVDIGGAANPKRAVVIAKKRLVKSRWLFQQPFAIAGAKVPIVQFVHTPTQTQCDVSFSSRAGVRNSELISHLLHVDSRALRLAIILKYWSKVHKLTGTNLFPNYSLIILVIFYLQHRSILPSVRWLQHLAHDCDIVEGWNTSFNRSMRDISPSEDATPLHILLGEFFQFYRDFNYKDMIISPYIGQAMQKSLFNRLEDVPEEFTMYIDIVSGTAAPLKTDSLMCVQDPFQHNRNCTVAVHQKLMITMTDFFALGATIFEECEGNYDHFLPMLLTTQPQSLPQIDTKKRVPVHHRLGKVTKRQRNGAFMPNRFDPRNGAFMPNRLNPTNGAFMPNIRLNPTNGVTVTVWNQHFLMMRQQMRTQRRQFRHT